ncbi:unnamed protein product [Lampetra fluviatilis]
MFPARLLKAFAGSLATLDASAENTADRLRAATRDSRTERESQQPTHSDAVQHSGETLGERLRSKRHSDVGAETWRA